MVRFSSAIFFALLFGQCCAFGETPTVAGQPNAPRPAPAVALSADIPPLPEIGGAETPLYLSARNVSIFHELLLAPVAQWVKEGKLVARLARGLRFQWRMSQAWVEQTKENAGTSSLSDHFTPTFAGAKKYPSGAPFGNAAQINQEDDLVKRAYKILWNSDYTMGAAGDSLYGFSWSWFGSQLVQKRAEASYFQLFGGIEPQSPATSHSPQNASPSGSSAAEPSQLLRRDVLRFLQPPAIAGFAALSWRFASGRDDRVWLYSPVIGKSREIESSNRSDPLLGSLLNSDDLLVWSTKIESVSARMLEEKVMLVPFATGDLSQLVAEKVGDPTLDRTQGEGVVPAEGSPTEIPAAATPLPAANSESVLTARGNLKRRESTTSFVVWNGESADHPQAPPWIPTSAFFVPRRVWIIELAKNDPYYLLGRQILVVDQESMLPVYKVVYDRRGVYNKTLVAGWTLAASERDELRVPVLGFLLAVDRRITSAVGIGTDFYRTFRGKESPVANLVRKFLDIKIYQPKDPVASPTPHEQAADSGAKRDARKQTNGERDEKPSAATELPPAEHVDE